MHSDSLISPSPRGSRDERGAVAILVALTMAGLLIVTAMVLDFGLVRIDRQVDKSAADAAATAGMYRLAASGTNGKAHPFVGVCAALRYLSKNDSRFSGVTDTSGTWTTGTGAAAPDGCTDVAAKAQVCTPGSPASWAVFTWNGTWEGAPVKAVIQSGYQISGTSWAEDTLPAAVADQNDGAQGCDQLAVLIAQSRKPGLGSLATSSDLMSVVRSVARVSLGNGKDAPAMLLLDQHGCMVLSSTSGGSGAYVHVLGSYSSLTGKSQPGTIHADTDAQNCALSPHQNVFYGSDADTIVAYAAPSATATSVPDPSKPGQITSVAGFNGVADGTIRDSAANVYGATGLNSTAAGTHNAPMGRELVTRQVIDNRYLGLGSPTTGVTAAVSAAQTNIFSKPASYFSTAPGWKVRTGCNLSATDLTGVTAADSLYIDCTAGAGYIGTAPIYAGTVVFAGSVKPPNTAGASVSLPNATHVYVFGDPTKDAISLGTGGIFSMHTVGPTGTNLTGLGGQCTSTTDPDSATTDKAMLFVKAGDIKGTGGLLQLCRTTVVMMGGRGDACLPTTTPTPPTSTPCGGGTGDGQIVLSGNSGVDWTAPNEMAATTDASGYPTAEAIGAWHDTNGPEDLALWDESAGLSSSPKISMSGGGGLHTVGVFMVPNAAPFTIGGGASQYLHNAQYIASDIALNGNAQLSMDVDPDAAVTVPGLNAVGLVR